MSQSSFARVLADFGSRLGLDGLTVDEQGAATLRVDDTLEFNLVESPDGQTVTAFVELGPLGVTVNAVCPGPIRTGMTAAIPEEAKVKFARRKVPLRRYGEPEEVAHAILSLALPASRFVNGAVLVVDGGMTAKND